MCLRGGRLRRQSFVRLTWCALLLIAGLFAVALSPQPAQAQVVLGSCSATINGELSTFRDTEANAIHVPQNSNVTVTLHTQSGVHRRQIFVGFGVANWMASDETDPRSDTTTVSVAQYALYGVGLYRVQAKAVSASGDQCIVEQLVNVDGNPVTTVAGGAATALEALSLLGIGGAAVRAASPGDTGTGPVLDPSDSPVDSDGFPKDPTTATTAGAILDRTAEHMKMFGLCALAALPALVLTSAAMAGGATPSAAAMRLPRVHWRPRFSIVGMGSGVVGGLAAVVLLQQTGRLFPNWEILGRALSAGLLAGILLPSLTRLIAVRRANRRLAIREAELNQMLAQRTTAAAPAWVATHRASASGAPARPHPDAAAASTFAFSAGTALHLAEERAAWARVQSVDGREGWVEVVAIERMG